MRAEGILRQVLSDVETSIHQARLNAVIAAVLALIRGGEVGLSALGRAISDRSYKHGIKRIDRLLGNRVLASELEMIYGAIARYVLRSEKRPVILLDWTEAGRSTCALTAAIPVQGRAIAIHSVIVPLSNWTSRAVEDRFLKTLQALLCPECKPILVGDAGFRAPWMRSVQAMGWDFVTRIRGRTQVQSVGEAQWQRWIKLRSLARRAPRSLGTYRIVRRGSVEAELVVVDQRSRRARSSKKRPPRDATAKRAARSHCEPWFLATSLRLRAKQIVAIYASRMQLELTFRDLKSHRFGWGFEDARCMSTSRIAIQLLLATLASLVSMLVGIAVEAAGLTRSFQANTTKRRVLSFVSLGRAAIIGDRLDLPLPNLSSYRPFVGIP